MSWVEISKLHCSGNLTARDKVLIRRQEKQAKEEAVKLEALKEVEAENRRIRQVRSFLCALINYAYAAYF